MRLPQNLAALWAKKNDLTLGKNLNFKAADPCREYLNFLSNLHAEFYFLYSFSSNFASYLRLIFVINNKYQLKSSHAT
jgi:hypothetical protein|tara:strand:+ start:3641 stop:3874 length:234 start_codon:yes stop_codon:yes gene_type:complete